MAGWSLMAEGVSNLTQQKTLTLTVVLLTRSNTSMSTNKNKSTMEDTCQSRAEAQDGGYYGTRMNRIAIAARQASYLRVPWHRLATCVTTDRRLYLFFRFI